MDTFHILTLHFFSINFSNILPSNSLITIDVFPKALETETLCAFAFLLNALPITVFSFVSNHIISFHTLQKFLRWILYRRTDLSYIQRRLVCVGLWVIVLWLECFFQLGSVIPFYLRFWIGA